MLDTILLLRDYDVLYFKTIKDLYASTQMYHYILLQIKNVLLEFQFIMEYCVHLFHHIIISLTYKNKMQQ